VNEIGKEIIMGKEFLREPVAAPPTPEEIRKRAEEGWILTAVEWERESETVIGDAGRLKKEIPFGLRVAEDCVHLEEDPVEKEALALMLEMIVADQPLSEVAAGLNREGYRTRFDTDWNQIAVFNMLPRLIEVAPQIFSSEAWRLRRNEIKARLTELQV
jgi:hypothetical protein